MVIQFTNLNNNNINSNIDNNKTQQNSRCKFCGDRDETIIYIISKFRKLAREEYKTRYNFESTVIQLELYKEFQFDQMNKWYMHNTIPVLQNDTHKCLGILTSKRIA